MLIWVFFLHFVGDFVLQSNRISKAKSKSLTALGTHIAIITLTLFIGLLLAKVLVSIDTKNILAFSLINGILHFGIDYITSKVSSYFYSKEQIHNFFVVIGFDQFLHALCYILSLSLIY